MAAPRLNTASPNPSPRRTLLNSGTVPTRRVLLKSGDGSIIHPKTAPSPEAASPQAEAAAPAPEAEFDPALSADQGAPASPSPEEIAEYERQLAEYNRQMEEYNRQMAEYEAQQTAQQEEAARRAAEEEAARKAAEEEAARKAAEEEAAAQKAREELFNARREAELAQAKAAAAAAAAAAAEAAARAQEAELKAKALAVQVPDGPVIKPVPTHDPAAPLSRGGSAALRPAGLAKPAPAALPKSSVSTLRPAGMAKPAPTALPKSSVSTLKPSGMSKPAPAALPKTSISTLKPAAAQPAAEAAPSPAAAAPQPAALKPSTLRPAAAPSAAAAAHAAAPAAPAAPAATAAPKPAGPALRPAAARPAAAALKPAAARPATTALKPTAARLSQPNAAKTAAPAPAAEAPQAAEPGEPISDEQPDVSVEIPGGELPPELTEEQLDARDAYLTMLQQQAEAKPLHKRPVFYVCLGILAVVGIGCTAYVMTVNKNTRLTKEMRGRAETLKKLSLRAEHNVHEGKKADIKCSFADAEFMLGLIIDPHQPAPNGDPLLGNRPVDGAMAFSPLLAYAAARDSKIEKLVFDGLREHCQSIDERLFEKLIGDIATATTGAGNSKINDKLRLVAKAISDSKGWKDKSAKNTKLARVWNAMVLRLTVKDLDEIISQLSSKELDPTLAETLVNCLDTVLSKIEDPDEQSKVADRVFESVNEEYRTNRMLIRSLARCRSQKALEHFKGMMGDKNNWSKLMPFFAYWGDDSQLAYIGELRSQTGGERRYEILLDQAMGSVFGQNRDRSSEEAMNLLKACFGNPFPDTSDAMTIIEQVDGVDAFKEGTPERAAADKRYQEIKRDRETKIRVINTLSGLYDRPWVLEILDRYEKDGDRDISIRGKQAKEKVKQNRENAEANEARRKAKYGA